MPGDGPAGGVGLRIHPGAVLAIALGLLALLATPVLGQGTSSGPEGTGTVSTGTPEPVWVSDDGRLLIDTPDGVFPLTPIIEVRFAAIAWNPAGTYALVVGEKGTVVKVFPDGVQSVIPTAATTDLTAVSWSPAPSSEIGGAIPYAILLGSSGQVLRYDPSADRVALLSDTGLSLRRISWESGYAVLTGDDPGDRVSYATTNQAPAVTITSPADEATIAGVVDLSGTAWDGDGSVLRVEVLAGGSSWQRATGTGSWRFRWDATDVRGDLAVYARSWDGFAYSALARVGVHLVPPSGTRPTVAITAPLPDSEVFGITAVLGTAADAEDPIELVEIRIDDQPWEPVDGTVAWSTQVDTQALGNGPRAVHARAFDGGLYSLEATVWMTIRNVNHLPIVTIDSPADGATFGRSDAVRLDARSTEDPDHDPLTFRWSEEGAGTVSSEATHSVLLLPGTHTLRLVVSDGKGTAEDSVTVVVLGAGNGAPSVSILSPKAGSRVSGVVPVRGIATDPDGDGLQVQVKIDAGSWQPAVVVPGTSLWSLTWDTTTLSRGTHRIMARAYDGRAYSPVSIAKVPVQPVDAARDSGSPAPTATGPAETPPPPPAVTVVTATAVGLAVLLLSLVEFLRYGVLKTILLPLYTRLRPDAVLDNFSRGAIYGFIVANPGAHYSLIKEALRLNTGTIVYHLEVLEKEGYILSERSGVFRRYYQHGVARDPDAPVDIETQILDAVAKTPGMPQRTVALRLGMTRRALHYHVQKLIRAGRLGLRRHGRETLCFPDERPAPSPRDLPVQQPSPSILG